MDENRTFPALALQFALGCGMCTVLAAWSSPPPETALLYPGLILVFPPLLYGICRLFLRRSRTLRSLTVLCVLLGGGSFLALLHFSTGLSAAEVMFLAFFCLWYSVQGAQYALKPPVLRNILVFADISILALVVFIGISAAADLPLVHAAPLAAGCAASMVALVTERIGRRMGPREWILVLLAFGALTGAVWVLVSFAAAPAGGLLVSLWNAAVSLAGKILQAAGAFLKWLISLIPGSSASVPEAEFPERPREPLVMPESGQLSGLLGKVLLTLLLLTVLLTVLALLGRVVIGGIRKTQPAGQVKRERVSVGEALKRLWSGLKHSVSLRLWLMREKDTPAGLYLYLEHALRRKYDGRRREETPREFLARLAGICGDPELRDALTSLIPAVEEALFGPSQERKTLPEGRRIRRGVRSAVRRQTAGRIRENIRNLVRVRKPGRGKSLSAKAS